MSNDKSLGKKKAALEAVNYVEDGMTLGLGTGSTAKHFIDAIGEKVAAGWSLRGVPTSEETRNQAEALGVEIIIPDETTTIDLAVDGADEADPQRNLIKGGGGALLREKIVANAASRFIVIADKSKRVAHLGAFALPVEIDPYGWALTVRAIRNCFTDLSLDASSIELRARGGEIIKSDGGHFIVDCALGRISDPDALEQRLNEIPGVIQNGLFCGMTDIVIYGDADGVSIDAAQSQ